MPAAAARIEKPLIAKNASSSRARTPSPRPALPSSPGRACVATSVLSAVTAVTVHRPRAHVCVPGPTLERIASKCNRGSSASHAASPASFRPCDSEAAAGSGVGHNGLLRRARVHDRMPRHHAHEDPDATAGCTGWRRIAGGRRGSGIPGAGDRTGAATAQDGDGLAAGHAGPADQREPLRADRRRCVRRPHQDRGLSGRRVRACVRDFRGGRGRGRRHVSFVRGLFREEVARAAFLRRSAVRLHRQRAVRVGSIRRRSGVVGRARRPVRHQAAAVLQHRLPDGRLVHPRNLLGAGVQGAALPDGRGRRRGAPASRRHRGHSAGRRDHAGAQVGRHRRQRMDRALARHGDRPAIGRPATITTPPFTSPAPASRSVSTSACGKASTPATGD